MDVVDGLDQEGLKAHEGEGGEQPRHLFLYIILVINKLLSIAFVNFCLI